MAHTADRRSGSCWYEADLIVKRDFFLGRVDVDVITQAVEELGADPAQSDRLIKAAREAGAAESETEPTRPSRRSPSSRSPRVGSSLRARKWRSPLALVAGYGR